MVWVKFLNFRKVLVSRFNSTNFSASPNPEALPNFFNSVYILIVENSNYCNQISECSRKSPNIANPAKNRINCSNLLPSFGTNSNSHCKNLLYERSVSKVFWFFAINIRIQPWNIFLLRNRKCSEIELLIRVIPKLPDSIKKINDCYIQMLFNANITCW